MRRQEDEGAWGVGGVGGRVGSRGNSAAVCLPAALLAIRQPRPGSPQSRSLHQHHSSRSQ